MNGISSHQEALKRRYMNISPLYTRISTSGTSMGMMPLLPPPIPAHRKFLRLSAVDEDDVASTVVPPVTVVLEGRSICHRIYLQKHNGYESLAMALHHMFVDNDGGDGLGENGTNGLDLSNAVPGYLVAYEDMEDDLLLAGDLIWKDFVRVVKRIRIIPVRPNRRKLCGERKD